MFPLSLVWGVIAQIKRHLYYLLNLSKTGVIPNIVIGNINIGGIGKTPTLIWLHNQLILLKVPSDEIAVLSRGYKRKTKGFYIVNSKKNAEEVGDEPIEIYRSINKEKNQRPSPVAVCEDRLIGLLQLKQLHPRLKLTLLDDGFQHLKLRHTTSIVLCDYNSPFTRDWPLPAGQLREFPSAAKYAKTILVVNCPPTLTLQEAEIFKQQLLLSMGNWLRFTHVFSFVKPPPLWQNAIGFTTTITSKPQHYQTQQPIEEGASVILITGIANPQRVVNGLINNCIEHISFPDHHQFTPNDWKTIEQLYHQRKDSCSNLALVTTNKDLVRLQTVIPSESDSPLFVVGAIIKPLFNTVTIIHHTLNQIINEN